MDDIVTSVQTLFNLVTNKTPRFRVHGGSDVENLALQNIQVYKLFIILHVILIFFLIY